MRKPKIRNKKYVPRYGAPCLPIVFALPKAAMLDLDLMPHLCVEAFAAGQANEDNAYTLANVSNLCALLAQNHSPEDIAIAKAGQDAMISTIHRGELGAWGFTGTEYQAVKACVTLCDQLQAISTRRTLRDVIVHLRDMA